MFPLAVSSLAGPGAIMAVIVLTDDDVYSVPEQIQTGLVMLVVLLVTYIPACLRFPMLSCASSDSRAPPFLSG